jgi:aspartyl aminopeptidase
MENLEEEDSIRMVIWFDNEEVGSESAHGAMSTLLSSSIERVLNSLETSVAYVLYILIYYFNIGVSSRGSV